MRASLVKRLKVSVPIFEDRRDPGNTPTEKYTAYVVYVNDIINRTQWKLYKRYSDFLVLYENLRGNQVEELSGFRFPNKSMFNTFSQFTKVRRREVCMIALFFLRF